MDGFKELTPMPAPHPLRQELLSFLTARAATPAQLREAVQQPLSVVSYHLKVLVAEKKVEVVDESDGGQHVYGVIEPLAAGDVAARSLMLGFLDAAWATMTERGGRFVKEPLSPYRRHIAVDDRGWREALAVTQDVLGKYERIFRASARRRKASGEDGRRNVIVCLVSVTELLEDQDRQE